MGVRNIIVASARAVGYNGVYMMRGEETRLMQQQAVDELVARARQARENAYAPYSHFRVGAALLTRNGHIYTGCNVENVSFGATICAERAAVLAAVSAGERAFAALALAAGEDVTPCGMCRQVLAEFSKDGALPIYCAGPEQVRVFTLAELLPRAFDSFQAEDAE
ncbi:MAG: cytidine deaminase [Ethanoligenens sp.]